MGAVLETAAEASDCRRRLVTAAEASDCRRGLVTAAGLVSETSYELVFVNCPGEASETHCL